MVGNDLINEIDVLGHGKVKMLKSAYEKLVGRIAKTGAKGLFQVHHIIGQEIFRHPVHGPFLKKLGFDKDAALNVLALPNKNGKSQLIACGSKHANRALHQGRHSADLYVNKVTGELDRIKKLSDQKAITDCEARWLVKDLQNNVRKKLVTGEIELNHAQVEALGNGAVSLAGLAVFGASAQRAETLENNKRMVMQALVHFKVSHYTEGGDSGCMKLVGGMIDFANPLADFVDIVDSIPAEVLDDLVKAGAAANDFPFQ